MIYLKDDFLTMRGSPLTAVANRGETTRDAATTLVGKVRDMAVEQLSEALANTLEQSSAELFEQASKQSSHLMYCLYMDTFEQIKTHQAALVSTFKRQFFQRYNDTRRRGGALLDKRTQAESSEFNLVEPDELELTLASNTLSHAMQVQCHEEILALDRRMGEVLEDPDLHLGANPLSAEVIAESLMDAIKTLMAGNKIKLMLVTRLNLRWPAHTKRVLQGINTFLVQQGVMPTIQLGVKRADGPKRIQEESRNSGVTPTTSEKPIRAEQSHQDMFAMLQSLMAMGRIGAGPVLPDLPLPGQATGTPPLQAANENLADAAAPATHAFALDAPLAPSEDAAEVLQRLTRIQHGEATEIASGTLDPALIANGKINVLRAIKNNGAAGGMGHMDAMTLDIVALMFDYILDDRRLPDPMKALIGRLQIPVLKVAMLDKGFFSHKTHPARKLLDTLAEAAIGWNASEGHESPLYQEVDNVVQRILNEFEDKVDIFTHVLSSFQQFLAEEKRRADERACHSAQFLQNQEQVDMARNLALETLQAHLIDRPAPMHIIEFLQGPWLTYMTHLYLQSGDSSEPWNRGLATIDDLLWSLQPKTSKEDRQKLVSLLPNLLKRLDDGIQNAGSNRDERDHFFTHLVRYHSEAVKAGLQGSKTSFADENNQLTLPVTAKTDTFAFDTADLRDLPEPVAMETDPRILREIATTPELMPEAEEIVVGDVIGLERMDDDMGYRTAPDPFDAQVQELKRGAWLEFTLDDDSQLRAKLAWVSPLRGTYLFTNRLGERAVSINGAGLAQKLRDGSARLVDNVALIDRAVSSLFERLNKSA